MTAQKFKLFIGYLGNGATVCNSAIYENGDYKTIAHISGAGNIRLYVKPDYIPAPDMDRIRQAAADQREKCAAFLDLELSRDYGYYRTLDSIANRLNISDYLQFFDGLKSIEDRQQAREYIKGFYMSHF